jgi:hypothetical protein
MIDLRARYPKLPIYARWPWWGLWGAFLLPFAFAILTLPFHRSLHAVVKEIPLVLMAYLGYVSLAFLAASIRLLVS